MFSNTRAFVCAVVVGVLLASCTAFNLGDANKFQKGMSAANVLGIVSTGPSKTFDITLASDPNTTYSVMCFDMALGGVYANYYAVFQGDKLLYWGHPYEFNRHPDPRLNEIGIAVVNPKSLGNS